MQIAIAPYTSTCKSHTPLQKVTQLPNTTATNVYMLMHRWNTSPPTPAMVPYASVHMPHTSLLKLSQLPNTTSANDKLLLPGSIGDNSNKDAFLYHIDLFP
eukprot:12180715-Ditylum_brightwellii.AAC.1